MTNTPAIETKPGIGRCLRAVILASCLMGAVTLPGADKAMAQGNPFAPVLVINDQVISRFELDQRIRFLTLLRQPGDLETEALKALTEDRLRMWAAKQYKIKVSPDQLTAGINEFAARANLTGDEFIKALAQGGVEAESFRDFVEAGLVWRELIRGKFGPTVSITEADIDRALANYVPTSVLNLQLAEIVLPATGAGREQALTQARRLKVELDRGASFADMARQYSQGPTARAGGELGAMKLNDLPKDAIAQVRSLQPGKVSDPIVLDDKVVLYQMLGQAEVPLSGKAPVVVDYALFRFAGGAEEAAKIRRSVDTCTDLYAVAKGLPAEQLTRQTLPEAQLPGDVGPALRLLDAGESTVVNSGGGQAFLMLCSRGAPAELQPSRDIVKIQLTNQQLAARAEIYMEELRSEAITRTP